MKRMLLVALITTASVAVLVIPAQHQVRGVYVEGNARIA